jgi:uncharacterized YceG family protein
MPDRTPEERERDRLEREAKRAAREGRSAPAPPAAPPPSADVPPPPPVGRENRPTDGFDGPSAPPPPATGREWRRAAGDPDPDPPLVRRVDSAAEREQVHSATEPLPEPAPRGTPDRRIPAPPPIDGEKAIGTKKVSGARRPHLPRRTKGSAPPPPPPRGGAQTQAATPPSGRRVWTRRVGVLAALALLALVLWFAASLFQPFSGDGTGTTVVSIPKNASIDQIADILEKDGVISSGWFFKLRAKLEGKDDQINSGRVAMKHDMSYSAALDALTEAPKAAPTKLTKLTLPEGLSRDEIAERVTQAGISGDYVKASRSSPGLDPRKFGAPKDATLEGFLFPATYDLHKNATADTLIAQQLKAFRRTISGVDFRRARRKNLTVYDVLVIASMIEREAGIAEDRPRIAAVIYNRLKQGMPLGIDATLRYALHNWTKPLKVSELEDTSNPYNTRKLTGLPPTPIGNPGLASIQAAAHPANVPYLFYVVKPCGNGAHNFSSTDAEFQKDVDAYDAKREELGGKSPVTCK